MLVPHQMIGTYMLKLQSIYAEYRLKPSFAQIDKVRLFVLEKQSCSLSLVYGVHDTANEDIRV